MMGSILAVISAGKAGKVEITKMAKSPYIVTFRERFVMTRRYIFSIAFENYVEPNGIKRHASYGEASGKPILWGEFECNLPHERQ